MCLAKGVQDGNELQISWKSWTISFKFYRCVLEKSLKILYKKRIMIRSPLHVDNSLEIFVLLS